MFGVLKSVQPLKPTSFQPRSSATMWTMLGFLSAARPDRLNADAMSNVARICEVRFMSDFEVRFVLGFEVLVRRFMELKFLRDADAVRLSLEPIFRRVFVERVEVQPQAPGHVGQTDLSAHP